MKKLLVGFALWLLSLPSYAQDITQFSPTVFAGTEFAKTSGVVGLKAGGIANSKLTNSSITIGSTSVSLGDTAATVSGLTLNSPTLTGTTTLPGSGAITSTGGLGIKGAVTADGETLAVWSASTGQGLRVFNTAAVGASSGGGLSLFVNAVPSAADQRLGQLSFGAIRTGSTYNSSAVINAFSAEAWGSAAAGAYLTGETAPVGSIARTERFRVYPSGEFGIGTAQTSPPANLFVARSSSTTYSAAASVLPRIALLNTNTTDNTVSQLDFSTTDSGGTNTASAKIFGRHTSHSTGAVSGELIVVTCNAGTCGEAGKFYSGGGFRAGSGSALATSATDGFLFIPTMAGAPTGIPTNAGAGQMAMVYDKTNNQLYIYNGGWKQPKTPSAAALVTWQ